MARELTNNHDHLWKGYRQVFMEMDDDDSGTLDRVEVAKLLVHHLRNIIIMIGTLD